MLDELVELCTMRIVGIARMGIHFGEGKYLSLPPPPPTKKYISQVCIVISETNQHRYGCNNQIGVTWYKGIGRTANR